MNPLPSSVSSHEIFKLMPMGSPEREDLDAFLYQMHVCKSGETLATIASEYGTSCDFLEKINPHIAMHRNYIAGGRRLKANTPVNVPRQHQKGHQKRAAPESFDIDGFTITATTDKSKGCPTCRQGLNACNRPGEAGHLPMDHPGLHSKQKKPRFDVKEAVKVSPKKAAFKNAFKKAATEAAKKAAKEAAENDAPKNTADEAAKEADE